MKLHLPSTNSFVFSIAILSVISFVNSSRSAAADDPVGHYALLIGIENYENLSPLPGVAHDVSVLRRTLRDRGGYVVESVVNQAVRETTFSRGDESQLGNLQYKISAWLAKRRPGDTIILYFSGHGGRDKENRLYLALKDYDVSRPELGGLPVAWLRERLVMCAAGSKLLILDACHSGSARSLKSKRATAKELGDFFEQTEGLVTLAGCSGTQNSYLWKSKNHSIFTYWLIQGMSGHADREPLGDITLNELDDYVSRKVIQTAKKLYEAEQIPTRLQGPNVTQSTVLKLKPADLKTLLDDFAEQIDVLIRFNELDRVGVVPEFASDSAGNMLGREYGTLATQCPVDLANRLAVKAQQDYRVPSVNTVREVLQTLGISPKDLGTSKSQSVAIEGRRLPALVVGQVKSLRGNQLALQCQLLDLNTGDILGIVGGTARLRASEMAMQGTSGLAVPSPPVEVSSGGPDSSAITDGREFAEIESRTGHPMQSPDFPYRVSIRVKNRNGSFDERPGTYRGKDYFVTLRRDEVFRIFYKMQQAEGQAFVKVFVDGMNTLPEVTQKFGLYVEPTDGEQRLPAQPISMAEARAWGPIDPNKPYVVKGFYIRTGQDAEYDEFKVVDAAQSVSTERGYSDQLGLISVAFYELKLKPPIRRGVAIGHGNRYRSQLETYRGDYMPGRLLGVVHIRYGQ